MKADHSILIFEDDIDLALQWRASFESKNIEVQHAASLDEAKAYCQQQSFDLIVCDMFIQDNDGKLLRQGGFSFIHYLRGTSLEHRPNWGLKVPILVVSGAGLVKQTSFLGMIQKLNRVTALKKPVEPADLVAKVLDILKG